MDSQNAFLDAVKNGDLQKVDEMLKHEPGLSEARTESGVSPVLLAMYYGRKDMAQRLAGQASSLNIFEAAALGDVNRAKELLESQPNLANAWTSDGFQPLGLASFFGNMQVAQLLLLAGARVNTPSRNNMQVMPLHSAVAGSHLEIAKALLAQGADPNAVQQDGFTPLQGAAQNGQEEMVRLLLEHGAEPAAVSVNGRTALDFAKESSNPKVVELLMGRMA
jgi:ankyrin repeat protein